MDVSNLKTLTKDDVRKAADGLINENGTTSTLEVKNQLRDDEFFAKQKDVSRLMTDLCDEGHYEYDFNGSYREYSLAGQAAASTGTGGSGSSLLNHNMLDDDDDQDSQTGDDDNSGTVAAVPTTTSTNSYRKVSTGKVIAAINAPVKGDWSVSDKSGNDIKYFDGKHSRDEVRFAYHKLSGVIFHNTRASRVK